MMSADILIIDDEEDIRGLIRGILEDEGYVTREAGTAKGAMSAIEEKCPDLIILDIWLQGSHKDGLGVLEDIKSIHKDLPVLMISGHGTVETAVSAIKKGAYDFIEKPFKADRLLLMIARAIEAANLRKENQVLKATPVDPVLDLIGSSQAIRDLENAIKNAANSNGRVLIAGEMGTGKSMIARLIHEHSSRSAGAYVMFHCFQDETEQGFMNAYKQAEKGTLVLNHIECLPDELHAVLGRLIQAQDQENAPRLISIADNRCFEENGPSGLPEDLLTRLSVQKIEAPTLKARQVDMEALITHFSEKFAHNAGIKPCAFSAETILHLQNKDWQNKGWPGNIGGLKNYIELCCMLYAGRTDPLSIQDLPDLFQAPAELNPSSYTGTSSALDMDETILTKSLRDARETFERLYLSAQIERFEGSVSETAKYIGMERSALHRKLKTLDISATDKQDKEEEGISAPLQKRA